MFKFLNFKTSKSSFKIYNLKFIILLLLITYSLSLLIETANAQSLSLSIWPPLLEVMIQPGRSVTQVYKLTNSSDHELQITPQIFTFKPQGENGEIKILTTGQSNFFSFASGERLGEAFYLPIGKEREIVLKISVPKNSPESDYYYTMLFSTGVTPNENKDSSSSSIAQIGTNILITVSQGGQPSLLGRVLEFSTPKIIDSFSPIPFTVRLENWGKSYFKPFGKIKLAGIFKQKEEIKLYEQNILAGSSRKLDIPEVKPKLPFGPFKASLEFSLGEEGEKLTTETTFWYLPHKILFAIFAGIVIIFAIIRIKKLFFEDKSPLDKES